jgi:hypothetical protein
MEPKIDSKFAKEDHQRACTKIILAKAEVAELRAELLLARAQYNECKDNHSESDPALDLALEDVRITERTLKKALERLEAAERLEFIRVSTLTSALGSPKVIFSSLVASSTADPRSPIFQSPWSRPRQQDAWEFQRRSNRRCITVGTWNREEVDWLDAL